VGRALSGLIPISSGRIELEGRDITHWPAHRRCRAGIVYIPEGRGVFPGLSVIDNLKMAVRQLDGRSEREAAIGRAIELFPELRARRLQRAGRLSGSEQQMLALARALAVDPKVIIADEMPPGLAPIVVDSVFAALDRARAAGITALLIEQFIHRAIEMADHCVVLSRGQVGRSGDRALLIGIRGGIDLASTASRSLTASSPQRHAGTRGASPMRAAGHHGRAHRTDALAASGADSCCHILAAAASGHQNLA
jgi:ABC-type branched-subunit amino acid transport system ATPase component